MSVDEQGLVQSASRLVSPDGRLILDLPERATALNPEGMPLAELGARLLLDLPHLPPAPEHQTVTGLIYDLWPSGAAFDPPVPLTLSYDPTSLPPGAAETDLSIGFYSPDTGQWKKLDRTVVNTAANTIGGEVSHFTLFAVVYFGEEKDAGKSSGDADDGY